MSGYRSGAATGRVVTKPNVAGQTFIGSASVTTGYSEITASLTADSLITHFAAVGSNGTVNSPPLVSVTIAVGASGAETPIAVTYMPVTFSTSLNGWAGSGVFPVPVRVGGGRRIAVTWFPIAGLSSATFASIYVFGTPYANLEGV